MIRNSRIGAAGEENFSRQIWIEIRNIYHEHVNVPHTDLPIPAVKADSFDNARQKIKEKFELKMVIYHRWLSTLFTKLEERKEPYWIAKEEIHRMIDGAKGQLHYGERLGQLCPKGPDNDKFVQAMKAGKESMDHFRTRLRFLQEQVLSRIQLIIYAFIYCSGTSALLNIFRVWFSDNLAIILAVSIFPIILFIMFSIINDLKSIRRDSIYETLDE